MRNVRRGLAVVLALVMLLPSILIPGMAAGKYQDVPDSSWYSAAVEYVTEKGYMAGVSEDSFAPNTPVTRAMFVTVLAKVAGVKGLDDTASVFSDVPAGKWYTGSVAWAAQNGIVSGVSATEFAPNRKITRQDMCVILSKFVQVMEYELPQNGAASFNDAATISSYARGAVAECTAANLIAGFSDGTFRPKGTATRAQIAVIIMRLAELLEGKPVDPVPMPAQEFNGAAGEDMTVAVNAPEGALPENTNMSVSRVTDEAALASLSEKAGAEIFAAADISFNKDGAELEPEKAVEVQIALDGLEELENPTVVHIKDDGTVEYIGAELISVNRSGSSKALRFYASSFSIYAVVDKETNNDSSRLRVQLWKENTSGTGYVKGDMVLVTRQDVDKLATIIPDGETPTVSNKELFCGWFYDDDQTAEGAFDGSVGKMKYTDADADGKHTMAAARDKVKAFLLDADNTIVDDETTVNIYPIIFNYFAVSYVDENGATTLGSEIFYSKTDSIEDYEVFHQYAPYEQGFRFTGWQKDDGDNTIYQNNDEVDLTAPHTTFRAQVQAGYWLSFVESPKTSDDRYKGATYNAPVFCPDGVIPADAMPTAPQLAGYTFGGWYETFNAGTTIAQDSWTNAFNFSGTITQDTVVNAKWTLKASVPYTLIVWKQSVNNNKNATDSAKTYDFAFSTTLYAAPNTAITSLDLSAYANKGGEKITVDGTEYDMYGFKYNGNVSPKSSSTSVKVNGSTIVNLYYDRELVTLNFYKPTYTQTTPSSSSSTTYYVKVGGYYYPIGYSTSSYYYYQIDQSDMSTSYNSYNSTIYYCFSTSNDLYRVWYRTNQWVYGTSSTNYASLPETTPVYRRTSSSTAVYSVDYNTLETSMSGLYGSRLEDNGYTWPGGYWWYDGLTNGAPSGTRTTFLDAFLPFAASMTANYYGLDSAGSVNVKFYTQKTDGTYELKNTVGTAGGTFYFTDKYNGFTLSGYSTDGSSYNPVGELMQIVDHYDSSTQTHNYEIVTEGGSFYYDADPDTDGYQALEYSADLHIRFDRNKYRIQYMVGKYIDGKDNTIDGPMTGKLKQSPVIYYEESIDSYKVGGANYFDPTAGTNPVFTDEAYVFEGWFVDPDCTTAYDFAGKTMPLDGVTVYAKFRQREYRVFLEPNYPSTNTTQFNVEWNGDQAMNFRVAYLGQISDGQPIEGKDTTGNYVLVGWYKDEACTEPFNFATKLNDDIAVDYDKTTDMTDNIGTSSASNADVNRAWITKKVVLYAKWRKVLPGANGVTLLYDAIEQANTVGKTGKFTGEPNSPTEWTDPLRYMDQADARARSASTPDVTTDGKEYQFLYWELLDKNGNLVKQIYPGEIFTVDANYAVEANATSSVVADPADGEAPTRGVDLTPPVRAGEKYELVTSPTAGEQYLLGLTVSGTTFILTTDYYNTTNNYQPYITPVDVTTNSDGTYSFSSSAYNLSLMLLSCEKSGSYWKFKNSEHGYFGADSTFYAAFQNDQPTGEDFFPEWTWSNGKLTNNNTSYYGYRYLTAYTGTNNGETYYDVDLSDTSSDGNTFDLYKLVDDGTPKHTLTIYYQFGDGTTAATTYTAQIAEGAAYSVGSPNVENCVPDKDIVSGVMGTQDISVIVTYTETGHWEWQPTDTIVPDEEYLIGFVVGSNVYLAVNKNINNTSSYYYPVSSSSDDYYGYTAPATLDGEIVTGVTGNATELAYCVWIFSTTSGGTISSGSESGRYLRGYNSAADLYVGTTSQTWTWDSANHTLSRQDMGTYMSYYYANSTNLMRCVTSAPTDSSVQLYSKVWVEADQTVYHTVTFIDGHTGNQIGDPVIVEDGQPATAPTAPNHEDEYYFFTGWNADFSEVTSDLTVTALYEYRRDGYYTVTFKDWNGRIIQVNGQDTQEVQQGHAAQAPANPSRDGYTFTGWDKDFGDVQSNLVVKATYSKTVTKSYTVTLRAVYGEKEPLKKTHVTWYANNGTGDSEASEEVAINNAIEIAPSNLFSYEGRTFLGWARLNESDGEGNPNSAITDLMELGEDDLWLVWHEEDGGYYTVRELDENGKGIKENGNYVELTNTLNEHNAFEYIAANENLPYHGLYAVWSKPAVFYVVHSATGKMEAVRVPGAAESVSNSNEAAMKGKVDLTAFVTSGYLYGGYYSTYGGVSVDTVNTAKDSYYAKNMHNWGNAVTSVRVGSALIESAYDLTGFEVYTGESMKIADNSKRFWTKANAYGYGAQSNADSGNVLIPEAGKVYYLKEVPDTYLTTKIAWTYDKNNANKLIDLFEITAVDDSYYNKIGFRNANGENQAAAYGLGAEDITEKDVITKSLVLVQGDKGQVEIGLEQLGVDGGYVAIKNLYKDSVPAVTQTVLPTWETLDHVVVSNYAVCYNVNEAQDTVTVSTFEPFEGTEKLYINFDGCYSHNDPWIMQSNGNWTWSRVVFKKNGSDEFKCVDCSMDYDTKLGTVTIPAGSWDYLIIVRYEPFSNHSYEDPFSNTWGQTANIPLSRTQNYIMHFVDNDPNVSWGTYAPPATNP